jgi:hypothetical protein
MEKQAVVKEGITPSVESGRKSSMIKNGNAFAKGEEDKLTDASDKLEKAIEAMYTGDK